LFVKHPQSLDVYLLLWLEAVAVARIFVSIFDKAGPPTEFIIEAHDFEQ
jgi:hypothetical protein